MVVLGICCVGLLAPNLASAKDKKDKATKPTAEQKTAAKAILKKYDTSGTGKLTADEITTLKKDYAAGNEADAKVFDVNNDNALDDSEIATLESALKAKHKKKSE